MTPAAREVVAVLLSVAVLAVAALASSASSRAVRVQPGCERVRRRCGGSSTLHRPDGASEWVAVELGFCRAVVNANLPLAVSGLVTAVSQVLPLASVMATLVIRTFQAKKERL